MATRLTIDEGNSSTKIGLWRDGVMAAECSCTADWERHARALAGGAVPVDALIFCSVRRPDDAAVHRLGAALARRVTVLSARTPLPLDIRYRTPATLGPDRIAAAAGARALLPGRTCLVVDMGTAITYDVVTADGAYLGGNIAPGIFVRLEALNHYTSALPLVEPEGDTPRWGYDTASALRSGAVRGVVGELQYYRHCLPADAATVLTGGGADLILPFITSPVTFEPNLVLIGLNSIISHNENL